MEARDRIRELLLRGDNRLKQGGDPAALARAREAYEEALATAVEAGLDAQVRPLVESRIAGLDRLADRSEPGAG